jgi:fumarylacetoacetase
MLDQTHDPRRRSWVETANDPVCDFPIQNLPYGAFSTDGSGVRIGVAIGDRVLDLTALERAGDLRPGGSEGVFQSGVLNPFMALPMSAWTTTRRAVAQLLDVHSPRGERLRTAEFLVPIAATRLHLPFRVQGYTDFYASIEHASNVGRMFRGEENALPPNWLHMPIGYNGRASTVVVSGTPIRRPLGQTRRPDDDAPRFGPSTRLDFELELGAVVGRSSEMGQPLTVAEAYDMIFGYVLLNDWSARDIQAWEYQPLGPFQSKAFGTTIGGWVVTRDALAPFRVDAPERRTALLPYLREQAPNGFDIDLQVDLAPRGQEPVTVCRTNFRSMYYSPAQQLVHHAVGGCAMQTGDLLGSGTVSGAEPDARGCLLELTQNGERPIEVDGATRTFLEDGDRVDMTGWCQGAFRVGFGQCSGTVQAAPDYAV